MPNDTTHRSTGRGSENAAAQLRTCSTPGSGAANGGFILPVHAGATTQCK